MVKNVSFSSYVAQVHTQTYNMSYILDENADFFMTNLDILLVSYEKSYLRTKVRTSIACK